MRIVYSFNKAGYEEAFWTREIAAASGEGVEFVPFNHAPYLDPNLYARAQKLDELYVARHPGLLRLYRDLGALLESCGADALVVDNFPPYHPEFLRRLSLHKVLRTSDGPIAAYDRDFAYLHAYDQVLYHTPAYSAELTMAEKLAYCGAKRADFWPMAVFDAAFDPAKTEESLFAGVRDVDVVFVGALHVGKMEFLARVKKALGPRLLLRGLSSVKKNVYFNVRYGFPGWVRPVAFEEYVPLYERAKIGINVHNRGDHSVGNYRLFELPANGVLQLSDGGEALGCFFRPGEEVVGYKGVDDLVDLVRHFLGDDEARKRIALAGYRRTMRDHRFRPRMREAAALIARARADARPSGTRA